MRLLQKILGIFAILCLVACSGSPLEVKPVTGFEKARYLGTWYEIARLDHSFERGLTDVTANYSLSDDGKVIVLNKGFDLKKGKFNKAQGKAKFSVDETTGHLKVSFFGPFYGDYIIFDLDKDGYSYAFVSGGRDNYLWLLARSPVIADEIRQEFIDKSTALGYDTDGLIWVSHDRADVGD